jgi:hypothetical protein
MGYVFILTFSRFGPQQPSDTSIMSKPIRLDLSTRAGDRKKAIAAWIQHGGTAGLGSVQNLSAAGSLEAVVLEARSMLQKMGSWGLAKKFDQILENFDFDGD